METLVTVFESKSIIEKTTSTVKTWPTEDGVLKLQLDDVNFTDKSTSILVTTELSWDGGITFLWTDRTAWPGASKSRNGFPPGLRIGPFLTARGIRLPSHVKVNIEPLAGTPSVGLKGNI